MTDEISDQVREKDHAVLACIRNGQNNTRQIREATTLSNRDVNYALDKLEDIGLIATKTPEGRVTEIVDGQKRNFKAPREARLTDTGAGYLTETDDELTRYQKMSYDEILEQVYDLEQRVTHIEAAFDAFRQQMVSKLDHRGE